MLDYPVAAVEEQPYLFFSFIFFEFKDLCNNQLLIYTVDLVFN